MQRVLRLMLGFFAFILAGITCIVFVAGALVQLITPWGVRSAPPLDQPPPSLMSKVPAVTLDFLFAFMAFIVAAYIARWAIGASDLRAFDKPDGPPVDGLQV